jgi:ribose 5-phosphate isomerase RpiB
MKIALINENSQASKNELIYNTLKSVAEPMGHTVDNYGMYSAQDEEWLTYVQNGILGALLLNSGAADYVITGCGTGSGAMLSMNSFPGVICGHIIDPADAFMFSQINDGNAISLPFAKGFGWGGECNLKYIFEKLFEFEGGGGYPKEKQEVERSNKQILDKVRENNLKDIISCFKGIDQELLKGAFSGKKFKKLFFENCKKPELAEYVKSIVGGI